MNLFPYLKVKIVNNMAANNGFIFLHRSIQEHWIYPNHRKFTQFEAFTDMVLMANYTDNKVLFDGQLLTVVRGSFITSLQKLSARWFWGVAETRHFIEILVKDCMVKKNSTSKYTQITICNYDKYQTIPQCDSKQTTNRQQTDSKQTYTNNKDKEEIKKDKEINIPFDQFWSSYDKKIERDKCERKWNALKDEERTLIMAYIPKYKKSQPDKQYRKNPDTFLNNKSWLDEIVSSEPAKSEIEKPYVLPVSKIPRP